MDKKRVNIDLPEDWFKRKEELNTTWTSIVGLGLQTAEKNLPTLERLREVEIQIERLKGRQETQIRVNETILLEIAAIKLKEQNI